MGLFVTFSAEELQEFEEWRRANAKDGEVIIIEAVSRRRPNSFKVWFEKPVAGHKNLPWYKPIQENNDETKEVSAQLSASARTASQSSSPVKNS